MGGWEGGGDDGDTDGGEEEVDDDGGREDSPGCSDWNAGSSEGVPIQAAINIRNTTIVTLDVMNPHCIRSVNNYGSSSDVQNVVVGSWI
ncbi:MAG: hypothetical protein HXS43_01730 [Theionarchaea archaeon]|nr:hypothetical protein [Theionarchaea archaeon]